MSDLHPYRELSPPPPSEHKWAVITEPSMFRAGESRLRGPYTEKQAYDFAKRWVRLNPHGEARISHGRTWPPPLNWEPRARDDDSTTDAYRE